MKRLDLSFPEFGFIVATRAALGAGIGLLRSRKAVGATLVAIGALTTIPAALAIRGARRPAPKSDAAA